MEFDGTFQPTYANRADRLAVYTVGTQPPHIPPSPLAAGFQVRFLFPQTSIVGSTF